MKLLIISTDRSLLVAESSAATRVRAYAEHFDTCEVILFSRSGTPVSYGRVSVHPTRSFSRLLYGWDALLCARRLSADVVTAQDPFETGLVALLIARLKRIPLHIQVHTDFLSPRFIRRSFLNRIRLSIARLTLKQASRIRVVSEGIKDALVRRYLLRVPISVLPIFVDTERYRNITHQKHSRFKTALLWIGRIEREKNLFRALDALKAARDRGHDVGLTVVGTGSLVDETKKYAEVLGVERFVEYKGWQADLIPFFARADLLLVTSDYEGYGMAMVEALSAGVPVLATDVGVARDVGAIVVRREEYAAQLIQWIARGDREGRLKQYPYKSFDDYVQAWASDVKGVVR